MTDSVQSRTHQIIENIFAHYEGPAFSLRLWDGWQWQSSTYERPVCTVVVRNPRALASLIVRPNEVTLGEAFIRDDLDVEGDLFAAFSIAEHLFDHPQSVGQRAMGTLAEALYEVGQFLRHGAVNSKGRDSASISYHYDQPVAFFEPWLGPSLVYSCAYFRSPQDTLEEAQEQKLELICRKLRLQPGERLLDIGCGWGSLVLHAAREHHARAHGVTLSREQAETACRRIHKLGLEGECLADLRDYRELEKTEGPFDKIASVGMFEHVGLKNLPDYFRIVHGLLKPGGTFLNHHIARTESSPIRSSSFVGRYVFPDGQLVTLPQALTAAEEQGLEVRDVENLREHYELTLRRWVMRLQDHTNELLELVPRATYRIWLLYMAGSAAAFHRGDIGVYQVLLSRPDHGDSRLPLTREDWYAESRQAQEVGV